MILFEKLSCYKFDLFGDKSRFLKCFKGGISIFSIDESHLSECLVIVCHNLKGLWAMQFDMLNFLSKFIAVFDVDMPVVCNVKILQNGARCWSNEVTNSSFVMFADLLKKALKYS